VNGLPATVDIREVGPRDGLQAEVPVAPELRARMIGSLIDAGIRHIEMVSFVSPKAVPAMSHPEEVLAAVRRPPGVTITALVPNSRGAELALACEIDEITVTIAASAKYNERNVKMTIDESLDCIESICELSGAADTPVDAVVSCAFGSPYEGEVDLSHLFELLVKLSGAGVSAVTLADTTGMATPRVVCEVLDTARDALGDIYDHIGMHMHETRGTGMVNCFAALQRGVSRFDTSVGGLGGSPSAEQAAGNVSTEDLVALFDDLGVATGIDLSRLLVASATTEQIVGHHLPSRVAYAGPRLARS